MNYLCRKAFEEKFNKNFYKEEEKYEDNLPPQPEIIFNWDEDNEESMKKICHCIFEKWWDNDRF